MPQPEGSPTLHRAARIEDAVHARVYRLLSHRGWQPRVLPYTGYGTERWARVLGRVLLTPPGSTPREIEGGRGWRRFVSATAEGVPVTVTLGAHSAVVTSHRGGYVDAVIEHRLAAGWATALLSVAGLPPSEAPVHVISPHARLGVVSDIDDTVMVTALPRPLVALWNTFLMRETARRAVPGMARLYEVLLTQHPDSFLVYLSTGPWNVAPALEHFLAKHGFPRGPLLMTDWGPTTAGWFRSGQDHKRATLRRLLTDLPDLSWIFVGDDGQHDPALYDEAASAAPGRVLAIAIRQLTTTEQVLTHGSPEPLPQRRRTPWPPPTPAQVVHAPDGFGLLAALRSRRLLPPGLPGRQPRTP